MVSGRRPKEHGEKDVRSPAKYKMMREVRDDDTLEDGDEILLLE